jgi:hypothetical protein
MKNIYPMHLLIARCVLPKHTNLWKNVEMTQQLAIRTKIFYLCLVEGERGGERKEWALMQEPILARAPRHFVRMICGSSIHKVVYFYSLLLYILTIELAIDYMTTYSR